MKTFWRERVATLKECGAMSAITSSWNRDRSRERPGPARVLRGRADSRSAWTHLRAGPALDRGGAGRRRDHDRLVLAPEGGEAEIEVSLATEDADADHAVVQGRAWRPTRR